MILLKFNHFWSSNLRYVVRILVCFFLCTHLSTAFAQSSTGETPGNDSDRSTRPIHGDSHSMGLFIVKRQPFYPPDAIAAGISGTVVLEATILGTGFLADVHVLSGPPMLQQESLKSVRTWRCRPDLPNDVPVVRKIKITLIFTLEEDGRATIKTTESKPEIVKTPSPADDAKRLESK